MVTAQNAQKSKDRLYDIQIDKTSMRAVNVNVEHEREVAMFDLLEGNVFAVSGHDAGPYRLALAAVEDRLVLTVGNEETAELMTQTLALSPYKKLIKDYFLICETYYDAIKTAPPSRIQAIDVSRRALHDEGSHILAERLDGKISVDFDTARRLFTLICALYWKG